MSKHKLSLADRLAINYVNVSVAPNNPDFLCTRTEGNRMLYDEKEYNVNKLLQFFKKDLRPKYSIESFGFSRNVLIIGNGASMEYTKGTDSIIDEIERSSDLDSKILNSSKDKKDQYLQKANHCLHDFISDKFDIEIVKRELLQFEGRLSVLGKYIGSHKVVEKLKEHVDYRYQPSGFYEIVAHLFKHRFIDLIINFNFDEMLDNAIEDEMGDNRMYMKVVNDSDCKPLQRICDYERLKMPIYIKPHGTISSESSMLFTKEQYIEISPRIKKFMDEILHGFVGATEENEDARLNPPKKIVQRFNFIIAGFSMKSIELNEILFSQLVNPKIQEINYYVFNKGKDNTEQVLKTIEGKIAYWNKMSPKTCSMDKVGDKKGFDISNLYIEFKNLYKEIRNKFERPYEPMPIIRHEILTRLFPPEKIQESFKVKHRYKSYLELIRKRILFNMLFDLIKFRGIYVSNISIGDRAGKYYRTYLRDHYNLEESEENKYVTFNMKDLLEKALIASKAKTNNVKLFEQLTDVIFQYIPYKEAHETYSDVAQLEKELKSIHYKVIQTMIDNSYCQELKVEELLKELNFTYNDIYNTGINEINPVYSDPKLGRFYHFKKDRVIPTNLGFTYNFFDFAYTRRAEWQELWFADDTGKAIFNLHSQVSNKNDDYLKTLIDQEKCVRLVHSNEKIVDHNKIRLPVSKALEDIFSRAGKIDNISIEHTDPIFNLHRMALFLKRNQKYHGVEHLTDVMEKCDPVFGIYFFKARTKNRINPVFFECTHPEHLGQPDSSPGLCNEKKNLFIMKNLFINQFDSELRNEFLMNLIKNSDAKSVEENLKNLSFSKKLKW